MTEKQRASLLHIANGGFISRKGAGDWKLASHDHTRGCHALCRLGLLKRMRQHETVRYEPTAYWWEFQLTAAGKAAVAKIRKEAADAPD